MWTRLLTSLLPLLLLGCLAKRAEPPALPRARPVLRVAVTIDDLPGNEIPSATWPKSKLMHALIASLRAHRVPAPMGFANGIYAAGDADAELGLRAWGEAGFPYGNHSYSHLSANQLAPAEFLADVARNQALLPRAAGPRYFRYPYLERGATAEQRSSLRHGLAAQGYRIADVSIDFADWGFSGAYARCAGDAAALEQLSAGYIEHALAALFWAQESAELLFGRAIPHVLLVHACVPTAHNIEALLRAYEKAGVQFITLDEALADPVYAEPLEQDRGDTNLITHAIQQRRVLLRSFVPRSLPLLDLACRPGG